MKNDQRVINLILILLGICVQAEGSVTAPSGTIVESYETTQSSTRVGKDSGFQLKQGQQFYLDSGDAQPLSGIGILLCSSDYGSPSGDISIEIYTNASGNKPGTAVNGTLKSFTPVLGQWNYISWEGSGPTLEVGSSNKYWIVVTTADQSGNDAYKWHRSKRSSDYSRGYRKTYNKGGSGAWSGAQTGDFAFRIYGDASLSVAMGSVRASTTPAGVEISWSTECETETAGFNIKKSGQVAGIYRKVNNELIVAKGRGAFGSLYSFTDSEPFWKEQYYKIEEVLANGSVNLSSPLKVDCKSIQAASKDFGLEACYPNPFNPVTRIEYKLPVIAENSQVDLTIYDTIGRMVSNLVSGHQTGGRYVVEWNGSDSKGGDVASGVYFAVLRIGALRRDYLRLIKVK